MTFQMNNVMLLEDGKVEYDGKCLDANSLELTDCNDVDPEKWILFGNSIMNVDSKQCLDFNKESFSLKTCDATEKNHFFSSQGDNDDNKYPRWEKKFGKNVVLVSSDNPWYLNRDTTTPVIVENDMNAMNPNYINYPKNYASVPLKSQTKFLKTQPEAGVEYFPHLERHMRNYGVTDAVIVVLLIIIAVQIICLIKKFKN